MIEAPPPMSEPSPTTTPCEIRPSTIEAPSVPALKLTKPSCMHGRAGGEVGAEAHPVGVGDPHAGRARRSRPAAGTCRRRAPRCPARCRREPQLGRSRREHGPGVVQATIGRCAEDALEVELVSGATRQVARAGAGAGRRRASTRRRRRGRSRCVAISTRTSRALVRAERAAELRRARCRLDGSGRRARGRVPGVEHGAVGGDRGEAVAPGGARATSWLQASGCARLARVPALDLTAPRLVALTRQLVDIESVSGDEPSIADADRGGAGSGRAPGGHRATATPSSPARTWVGPAGRHRRAHRHRAGRRQPAAPARGRRALGPRHRRHEGRLRRHARARRRAQRARRRRDLGLLRPRGGRSRAQRPGRLARNRPELLAADFAILCEPSNAEVEGGCNGTLRVDVRGHAACAPTARASWMGDERDPRRRARAAPARRLRAARGRGRRPGLPRGPQRCRHPGGVAGNVIPDECVVEVNYRFAPDRDAARRPTRTCGTSSKASTSRSPTRRGGAPGPRPTRSPHDVPGVGRRGRRGPSTGGPMSPASPRSASRRSTTARATRCSRTRTTSACRSSSSSAASGACGRG